MLDLETLKIDLKNKQYEAWDIMAEQFKLEVTLKQIQSEMAELEKQIKNHETPQ
jgi:hypothetical protein